MKTIALDVDGVLADFMGAVTAITGNRRDSYPNWDFWSHLGTENKERVLRACLGSKFWCDLELVDGAYHGVRRLAQRYKLLYVTAPFVGAVSWERDRRNWLHRYFGATQDQIFCTSTKHDVHADVFIDDRHTNVEHYAQVHRGAACVLFDNEHNRQDFWPNRLNWKGIEGFL